MDLGIFTIPLMLFLGLFGASVATETSEVVFEEFTVPAQWENGYTSQVVTERVADAYQIINQDARTAKSLKAFGLSHKDTFVSAVGDRLDLKNLVTAARDELGMISFKIGGDVVEQGGAMLIRVHVNSAEGGLETHFVSGPVDDPEPLFLEAAMAAMRVTSPYVVASYLYEIELDQGTTNFEPTYRALEQAFARLPAEAHHWLYNLWGLALLNDGKPKEAIEEFHNALHLQPGWPLSIHNWGKALTAQGRYEEAIETFKGVIANDPRMLRSARAYAEWSKAALLLGRYEEAEQVLRKAIKLDPQSSYVYYRWGQLLEAKGQLQEAARKYRLALLFQPKRVIWQSDIDRVGGSVTPEQAPKLTGQLGGSHLISAV